MTKGHKGFNSRGEEVFYVPQNLILICSGRKISVDNNPSHLEELGLYFSEFPVSNQVVDTLDLPEILLSKFRDYCNIDNANSYQIALEIRDYFEDMMKLGKNNWRDHYFKTWAPGKYKQSLALLVKNFNLSPEEAKKYMWEF